MAIEQSTEARARPLETGELLGSYRLVSRLGEARLAEVWLGEHVDTKERAALRRMKPVLHAVPRAKERFLAEANVLSAITHASLPRVFEVVDDGVERWCTQEPVLGERLDEMLAERPLPLAVALEGLAGIAAALAQLHPVGIAHRGVHPKNVVVVERSRQKTLKLLGFGGCHLPGPGIDEPPVPSEGAARYLSPEERDDKEPDTRSDVWALGKLMRELLPAGGGVPVAVDELILSCLEEDPADRPRDVGAIARVLVDALEESGVVYRQKDTGGFSQLDPWNIPDTSAENPLAPSTFPRRFGVYHLLASLGRGGMGDVCLARTIGPAGIQRVCVIKQIRVDKSEDQDYVRRFVDEARVMAQLNHANICHVLEVGVLQDTYYLAMEHIHGVTLSHLAARRAEALPRPVAIHIVAEILEGLDYAHRHRDPLTGAAQPVVHRDVSPHNVMVNFEGEVKLIDFGLAATEMNQDDTGPDVVMGKVAYMAPEQARGEATGRRADMYAAAIVATELLLGERFYADRPSHAVWGLCAQGGFLPQRFDALPGELAAVLKRALAARPEDRFEDCRTFKAALLDAAWGDAPPDGRSVLRSFMQEACADEMQRSFQRIQDALKSVPSVPHDELMLREDTPFTQRTPVARPAAVRRSSPARAALLAVLGAALLGALGLFALGSDDEDARARDQAPKNVQIAIVTEPDGATVLRADDKSPIGVSPVTVELPASPEGVLRILVEREGFHSATFEARLDRDRELRAQLRPVVVEAPPPPPAPTPAQSAVKPARPARSPAEKKPAEKKIDKNSLADPW